MCTRHNQRGISLIELIMFIVIVSVSLAGILLVLNVTTKSSADPLVHKQALAIAESLLEEIELMPFTYCDPTDANAASAVNSTVGGPSGCATLSQDVITGPVPAGATRYSAGTPYNNVADYSTFNMNPILDITGANVGLSNYAAVVTMTRKGTTFLGAADNGAALLINVAVTGPDGVSVALDGIRTRYAPNGLP
jgi:MSHA pilin protein MshD